MGYYLARVFLFFFFFLWIINFVFPMVFLLSPSSMCLHWDQPPRGVKGTNRSHVLFLSFLSILNLKKPRFPNRQIYCYFPLSFSLAQIATPGFTHLMAQFPLNVLPFLLPFTFSFLDNPKKIFSFQALSQLPLLSFLAFTRYIHFLLPSCSSLFMHSVSFIIVTLFFPFHGDCF